MSPDLGMYFGLNILKHLINIYSKQNNLEYIFEFNEVSQIRHFEI